MGRLEGCAQRSPGVALDGNEGSDLPEPSPLRRSLRAIYSNSNLTISIDIC